MDENLLKITEAKMLLRKNDYIVTRLNKQQKADRDECEESNGEKDCSECSCSACIIDN